LSRFLYIVLFLIIYTSGIYGQEDEPERYVQVSGIIADEYDMPVAGVTIISKKLRRGAISERTGIYSITSMPGDTVFFRAMGYKRYHTIIPENYTARNCNVDIKLEIDTIRIDEVTILPWRTYGEFIKDVTREKPKDPIIENMNDNIASIYVAIANEAGAQISGASGYRYAMEQNFSNMATRNQYPVNNLLNPFAWAKFIDGMKHGLLKNKKYVKPVKPKVLKKSKKATKK